MGNTCKPMAVLFQCMTKFTTNKKKKKELKKELKPLFEDPPGVADQLDQLLGPQIFTWVKLMSVLGVVFSG